MPYYGLYIPIKGGGNGDTTGASATNSTSNSSSTGSGNDEKKENETAKSSNVFHEKSEALLVLKQHKDARVKEFLNEEDAIKYAETGFVAVRNKYHDNRNPTVSIEKAAFRAPTRQELARFRHLIENGAYDLVKKHIWDNPRYLVSSGDTPTTLKEGYRYNAMHVCAISKSTQIAELILQTVSDLKFVELLLGKNSDEKICKEMAAKLLDYYLNMPEKGRSETPLHIAAKNGCLEMVEVLTSYPECRMTRNKDQCLPKDILFSRREITDTTDTPEKIYKLLDERYYVPVLRSNDSAVPGQIGEPFSATDPPTLNCDPLSPEIKIKALAGPMQKEKALKFYRRWKTPPRLGSNMLSPIANNPYISPRKPTNSTPIKIPKVANTSFSSPTAKLQGRILFNSTPNRNEDNETLNTNGYDSNSFEDKQNGNQKAKKELEESNNNISKIEKPQLQMLKTALCPRTPLFKFKKDAFKDYRDQNVASPIVGSIEIAPEINDSLFNISDIFDSPGFKERHVKNTDVEKGIECIGRELAKVENVEWREYWDFLDEFVDISSVQGLKKLESHFAKRQKEQDQRNISKTITKPDILDDVCNALENAFRNTTTSVTTTSSNALTTAHLTTPYTYVEKSLQVHARRMTKTIINNIDNALSINDSLLLELRRVKSLIYSFKEDASYINVNFQKVHSRIGNLVSMFLENSQEVSTQIKDKILTVLKNISQTPSERREHMECVCSRIFYALKHPTNQVPPENLKTEEMCSNVWSQEKECDCQWESNLSRKTSRRNRMEARYKNHQRLKQQEKEQKLEDKQRHTNDRDEWRDTNNINDSSDEEVFWSDFGGSDTEEDEVFYTPPQSLSRLSLVDDDDSDKIFIYGNEPTKRDLDVLNAIFHIEIDKTLYPNIHSWKSTLMRYSNEEMDYFPSPRIIKKSHSFFVKNVQSETANSLQRTNSFTFSNTNSSAINTPTQAISTSTGLTRGIIKEPILQLPTAKRLFISPGMSKSVETDQKSDENIKNSHCFGEEQIKTADLKSFSSIVTGRLPIQQQLQHQKPLTPLNKLKGLFSAYRERLDSSPLSNNTTDGSSNSLSLLNVSASE